MSKGRSIGQLVQDLETEQDAAENLRASLTESEQRIGELRREIGGVLGFGAGATNPAALDKPNGTRKDLILAVLKKASGPVKSLRIGAAIGCPAASMGWYLTQLKNEGKIKVTGARGFYTLA